MNEDSVLEKNKYKMVVEIMCSNPVDFNGYLQLTEPGQPTGGKYISFLNQAIVEKNRMFAIFSYLEFKRYDIWLCLGSTQALTGNYQIPLVRGILTANDYIDRKTWDCELTPTLPLTLTSANRLIRVNQGWIYVFFNDYLWREVMVINEFGCLRDIDLGLEGGKDTRVASGHIQNALLLPYKSPKAPTAKEETQVKEQVKEQVKDKEEKEKEEQRKFEKERAQERHEIKILYTHQQLKWLSICRLGGIDPQDLRFYPGVHAKSERIRPDRNLVSCVLGQIDFTRTVAFEEVIAAFGLKNKTNAPGAANQHLFFGPLSQYPILGTLNKPDTDISHLYRNANMSYLILKPFTPS